MENECVEQFCLVKSSLRKGGRTVQVHLYHFCVVLLGEGERRGEEMKCKQHILWCVRL